MHITREFCSDLSDNFRKKFSTLLKEYPKEKHPLPKAVVDYVLEKNFILPQFIIAHADRATELLKDFRLKAKISDKSFLLVFQLPKPLAQFWWKGGAHSWGSLAEDVEGRVTEWGYFYRELMEVVWEVQGYYENEKNLDLYRLNEVGEHDPKKFYYVWDAGE